jgi:hypothetical protein
MISPRTIFIAAPLLAVLSACTGEPVSEEQTPDTSLDVLDEQDQGTSYNGWTQAVSGVYLNTYGGIITVHHTLSRSYGDATRGGGGCFVVRRPGTSCSADSQCQADAQAAYGASAYGYCFSGQCYARPGSQASYCALNPNRSPGTVSSGFISGSPYTANEYGLGCMTKTAGPNTACGGTNASLYMREVAPLLWTALP